MSVAYKPYQFWASCPRLPGELVQYITDSKRAQKITYQTFARYADLTEFREGDHPAMYRISAPDNWAISFWKSTLPSGQPTYYFDWSRFEHFFVDETVDLELEMEILREEDEDEDD